MRSNGLLKWLMVPLALVVLVVGLRQCSGGNRAAAPADPSTQLTPEEMQALGITGDTPRDTVATLVAQVRQLRTELQSAVAENKAQRDDNAQLRQRDGEIDRRIASALESEREKLRSAQEQAASEREQTSGLLQELQQRLEQFGAAGSGKTPELPIGLGLEDEHVAPPVGTRWVEPEDATPEDARKASGGGGFPTRFGPAQRTLDSTADALSDPGPKVERRAREGEAAPLRAVYTVPTNATLMGSVAMTALIGRIPIDGTVNDPFPFKVLVGPDNLTANGIDLPDVAGAVFSGTASGDWTLSCVRGKVRSITFVFSDGTIRTVPDNADGRAQGNDEGLGWISDPQGIPCVSGDRRSNAQQYLGSQALITAAGAGVASFIKPGQNVAVVSGGSGNGIGTVGISGNEAMGRILAGGVQQMSDWVNKLYGQAFAAVYVRPGAKVAVHLEKPINIDYAPDGRRVDHRGGSRHALDLD
ncbi:TIGR03752 family integrating conjugative element protein [Delftia lacustris]|uniref:TIGR03752 family integrating conjugative element protein n=1 Tax=Delftia lacustris TaxID=558537 RepID=UPI00193AEAEC|nr:TIGR03752 family integrating conjugative element protein [Delftia lacustris]QRI93014.1 TIGR03752 family integrating conjugative element protein [Delftia lacustris]